MAAPMIDRLRLAVALSVLAVAGCDQTPKEVSVVQQLSQFGPWDDTILVYGFAYDNVAEAEKIRESFKQRFPSREYRVVTRTMPMWKYERLKKQIGAP
jgi:hypothetical protein